MSTTTGVSTRPVRMPTIPVEFPTTSNTFVRPTTLETSEHQYYTDVLYAGVGQYDGELEEEKEIVVVGVGEVHCGNTDRHETAGIKLTRLSTDDLKRMGAQDLVRALLCECTNVWVETNIGWVCVYRPGTTKGYKEMEKVRKYMQDSMYFLTFQKKTIEECPCLFIMPTIPGLPWFCPLRDDMVEGVCAFRTHIQNYPMREVKQLETRALRDLRLELGRVAFEKLQTYFLAPSPTHSMDIE